MPASLLYVTQVAPYADGPAGAHGVLAQSTIAMAQMADLCGLELAPVNDVRQLSADALESARMLALFTIGETPWSDAQRAAILERLQRGALSVAAIHAATDSCYGWPEYGSIVGARFNGHPWTATLDIDVVDHDHPATAHLGDTWHWHDEVYQFRDLRSDAQVLLRAPDSQLDLTAPGATPPSFGFPLSWCFTEGAGRVFSTSLGHFPGAWESVDYLRHLLGGLRWAIEPAAR
jgi:type 1 glutamine amidotransferase